MSKKKHRIPIQEERDSAEDRPADEAAPERAEAEARPDDDPPADGGAGEEPQEVQGGDDRDAQVAELEEKVRRLEDKLLRAKADYANLQRRAAQERADAVRFANVELMRSLVPVIDDFERALAGGEGETVESLREGMRLVYENLVKAMQSHGLEPIEALHRPFDPTVHDAMLQQPSPDHPENTVLEEVARGYRLGDRVVRPSRVIVSKKAEG